MLVFKIVYWAGLVGQIVIRYPYRNNTKAEKSNTRESTTEKILLGLLSFALIPALIYTFTPWLDFANYSLPGWVGWLGVVILVGSLYVFWRAHTDLASNWSPTLEIYAKHTLVTKGIYGMIRHPMYASQLLFAIAQVLLWPNWIAGPIQLIIFIPFYLLRVRAEEIMMEEIFGEEYKQYEQRTGRVVPKF
jgi:protein-S-isoprenylcysteine O-methyltransferase Ste14